MYYQNKTALSSEKAHARHEFSSRVTQTFLVLVLANWNSQTAIMKDRYKS